MVGYLWIPNSQRLIRRCSSPAVRIVRFNSYDHWISLMIRNFSSKLTLVLMYNKVNTFNQKILQAGESVDATQKGRHLCTMTSCTRTTSSWTLLVSFYVIYKKKQLYVILVNMKINKYIFSSPSFRPVLRTLNSKTRRAKYR